jgi:hypothetical protein
VNPGSPLSGAESDGDDGVGVMTPIPHPAGDAGATNTPDPGPSATEGIQPVRDEMVAEVARALGCAGVSPFEIEDWRIVDFTDRLHRAGYRRVTDDDVERVARAMATKDGWQWDGEYGAAGKPDYWRWAAEAVRALREET